MPASVRHLREQLIQKEGKSRMSVFAKWPGNRLFYEVKLLKLDANKRSAYVSYEDGTECWANNSELHLQFHDTSLPYETDDDIVCCVCDDGISKSPNDIILCDLCQQGYHQKCHDPNVRPSDLVKPQWNCSTCEYILSQYRNTKSMLTSAPVAPRASKKTKKTKDEKKSKAIKKQTPVKLPKRSAPKPNDTSLDNPEAEVEAAAVDTSSDDSDVVVPHKSGATMENYKPLTGYTKTIVTKHPVVGTEEFVQTIEDIPKEDENTDVLQDPSVDQELGLEQELKKIKQAPKTASQESKGKSDIKKNQTEPKPKKVQPELDAKKVQAEPKKTRARKAPAAVKAPRGAQVIAPPPA